MSVYQPGSKPIVKSAKLKHQKRTVVIRQELAPRAAHGMHAKWKVHAGGAAVVSAAIVAGAGAQAMPVDPGPGGLDFGPTPAAEIAIAPAAEPTNETILHVGPRQEDVAFEKVSDLKDNPYVASRPKKPRIVKRTKAPPPAYAHVDDLKDNPY